jgi:hypothetical protein
MLPAKPRNGDLPILYTKHPMVSSRCQPLCLACQLAKQTRQTSDENRIVPIPDKEMMLKRTNLRIGQMVSIDQYMGSTPGRSQHTKGKEPLKDKYTGGTIFVDHASGFTFVQSQESLNSVETIVSMKVFEAISKLYGVQVKPYHADNLPFNSEEFQAELQSKNQTMDLLGVGAHHQNGVAERAIRSTTSLARAMLIHMTVHWPDETNLQLWPYALNYAAFVWNHLPNKISRVSQVEIFSST